MLQKKGGMLIQFINLNCVGATNLIGGIRISLDDIRRIPAYLARYMSMVKLHTLFGPSLQRKTMLHRCKRNSGG
jgi:hypothetical protein